MAANILVIEDEPAIQELLSLNIVQAGHNALRALSVEHAQELLRNTLPDLILLDWMLPGMSGIEYARRLKADNLTKSIPIIMLTARGDEFDKVRGLEVGADDYVTKPFRIRELAARVNAVYRRSTNNSPSKSIEPDKPVDAKQAEGGPAVDFTFEDYKLSSGARRLWDGKDVEIVLTTAEFDLLVALLRRRGHVLDREQLMNATKGRDWESYDRAVDGLVSRLRKKIPSASTGAHFIRTVHGVGYTFTA